VQVGIAEVIYQGSPNRSDAQELHKTRARRHPFFHRPRLQPRYGCCIAFCYSGTDRMTSVDFGERNAYPFDGEMYYVSDQPSSGRTLLNRYLNAGATDHADGISPPNGYTLED
jgi:hypothetical protein